MAAAHAFLFCNDLELTKNRMNATAKKKLTLGQPCLWCEFAGVSNEPVRWRWWDGWRQQQEDGTHTFPFLTTKLLHRSMPYRWRRVDRALAAQFAAGNPALKSLLLQHEKNPVKSRRHAKHDVSIASPSLRPPPTPSLLSLAFFSN